MIAYVVAGLIILLLVLLINRYIKIRIVYDGFDKKSVILDGYFFGIRIYHYEYTVKDLFPKDFSNIKDSISYIGEKFDEPAIPKKSDINYLEVLPLWVKQLNFHKIIINRLKLEMQVNMGDAAFTAISVGVLHTLINMAIAYIEDRIDGDFSYIIEPEYEKEGIKIYFECIFLLRIRYIITALYNGFYLSSKKSKLS